MVEDVESLFEQPGVAEELILVGVVLGPHVLDVAKVFVEVSFDDFGACLWGFVSGHERFSESVEGLVVFVFQPALPQCFRERSRGWK